MNDWYIRNGMLPNPTKSEALVIGTHAQLSKFSHPMKVDVAGVSVQCKDQVTSLGVVIDAGLTLDARVSSIISSCSYHLRALSHIRQALDNKTAETVGRAIILSRLDYCNSLLPGISEHNLDRLQRLQNRLVRAVARLPYRAHVSPARVKLHWLPVRERIKYKLAVLAYNACRTNEPRYLLELLTTRVNPRVLRSSADVTALVVPRIRSKRASRAFSYAAPLVWNALPTNVRECDSLATFKKNLKSTLFV